MSFRWELLVSVIAAVFASSGFWAFLNLIIEKRAKKKSAETKMLEGLGHDRICHLGAGFIRRGYITRDEYENLHDYLYLPYKKMGGNGTADKIMKEVDKLPLKERSEANGQQSAGELHENIPQQNKPQKPQD